MPERGAEGLSLWSLVAPPLERWRFVLAVTGGAAAVAVVASLLMPPTYTARAQFTPQTQGPSGLGASLAGLAGLAGTLNLGALAGQGATPEFFATVVESQEVLAALLRSEFDDPENAARRRTLLELMKVRPAVGTDTLSEGLRRLERLIDVSIDRRAAVLTVTVRQRGPKLAADVTGRLLDLLNEFNLERRQSQSREQARFALERLRAAESELRQTEDAQLRFLQANRSYRESPLLRFEAARLERAVQLKQEVVITLAKSLEEARILEVRDTPVLTIVDAPRVPDRRSSPRRTLIVLVSTVLAATCAVLASYLLDLRAAMRNDTGPDAVRVIAAWADLRGGLAGGRRGPRAGPPGR